ncbi:Fc.00g008700.m01.CDS01 [Cosmosporella sp. VM-42]
MRGATPGACRKASDANKCFDSTNLVIILGMMQVAKRVPFDDPFVLNLVRAVYLGSNLIIAAIYFYCATLINKKKDMTTLKYVEPAPMGSTEEGKLVTTTIHAYDKQQIKTAFRGQLMGVGMMAFMHIYMKYTNPLLIQSIIPLKSAFESNIVKIHLLGKPAAGDLKRPFKQAAGFMSAMQGGPAQSDKKAVEAAERSGRGGAKEE